MRWKLALIFFLSGVSALVFESLWFRLAGLSLGNSVWSASLVLAAFMGGLAIGNALVARFQHRVVRPVRLYAALELIIGIGGIAAVLLLPRMTGFLGPLFSNLAEWPLLLNTTRLTIAFVILVLPAIAMGATLPVLAQALSKHDKNFGSNIGWLYGWNTLGAMLAAFCTELVLVPVFGILASGLFALALNLAAALFAMRISQGAEAVQATSHPESHVPRAMSDFTRRCIAVAFFSGALMLALEVVWFRFLLLTRDGTSLIFGIMLAVVLAGIAAGGFVAARLFRQDDRAYRWLRHVVAATAILVVLTYAGYDLFSAYRTQQDTSTVMFICFAAFLMFPVALLSGIAFTMVNRAVKDELGSSARTAGIATFFNTVGAMLGSIGAGFVLLPLVGMELSFFLISAMYFALALVAPVDEKQSRSSLLWGRGAIAAAVVGLALFPFGLMQNSFFAVQTKLLPGHSLVTTREGTVETLRYYRRDVFGEPKYYRLVTNGHSMSATSTAAKRYMKLYAWLPLALKPDTRDALLISFGVGSTAKALTDSRGLQNIDIVDISEDILELSNVVYPGDDNPLLDERVRVHVEDGRFFLNTSENRYDLITSEPPPPKIAGVVNLYSQEYFELIRERLNSGGFATYWLPVQLLEPTDTLAIVKAFCNAFDDCSLWSGAGLEWMLMGSNNASSGVDARQFSAQWRDPKVGPELVSMGLEFPEQLGSLFMADAGLLGEITADVAPVTDNYPARISSRYIMNPGFVDLYDQLMNEDKRLEHFRNSDYISRMWPAEFRQSSQKYFAYERLIKSHFTGGLYHQEADPFIWEAIDNLLANTSFTTLPLWLLGSDRRTQEIILEQVSRVGYEDDYALELARKYAVERDYQTALGHMSIYLSNASDVSERTSQFYMYLLAKNGMAAQAGPSVSQAGTANEPVLDEFFGWYADRFLLNPADSLSASGELR